MSTRSNRRRRAPLLLPLALIATAAIGFARQSFGPAGLSPGDLVPGDAAGDQRNVEIARGATGYLAVWQDSRMALTGTLGADGSVNPASDIYAARLDANGALIPGSTLIVNQAAFSQIDPVVAWNGTHYLVVWESTRPSGFWKTDGIYAARVTAGGVLLDPVPIVVEDSDDQDEAYPVVASDGTDWVVLWTDYEGGATEIIGGARITSAGVVAQKQTVIQPASPSLVPRNYDFAFGAGRYMFAYEQGWGGFAQARPIGTNLLPLAGGVSLSNGTGFRPGVAGDANGFFVSWTADTVGNTSHVRGTPVLPSGFGLISNGIALSAGAQVWTSSASSTVASNGGGWTIAWESFDFGPGQTLHAAQVDAAGNLLAGSPFDVVPSGQYTTRPALADGGGQVVLAWGDGRNSAPSSLERDVFGATIGAGAGVGPQGSLAVGPPAQTHPELAGDRESGYLLVFRSEYAGVRRVMAQRLDGRGAVLDPEPVLVASGDFLIGGHDVAWNGSEWLVVWERRTSTSALLPARVHARRMLPDGTLLDTTPLDLMPGNDPAVDASNGIFLVTSSEEPTNHVRFIRGQRVDGAGALVGGLATLSGSYAQAPAVLGLADRWLVAWQKRPTHDNPASVVQGNYLFTNGATAAPFALEANPGSRNFTPSLARGDRGAMLAFADLESVRVRALDEQGTPLGAAAGTVLCDAPNRQFAPSIGFTGDAFLCGFDDWRLQAGLEPGLGDVYAGRATRDAAALDFFGGLAIGAAADPVEGNPAVAGGGGYALTAHAAIQETSVLATHRIVLRVFDDAAVGDRYCFGEGGACPCGNDSASGGCANSTGVGAALGATGSASVAADALVFRASSLPPGQPTLLFQGTTAPGGGDGLPFGDGLRCVGGSVVRLAIRTSDGLGSANFGPGLAAAGQWQAGASLNFQTWYRDPNGSPCGSFFSLSNALRVTIEP